MQQGISKARPSDATMAKSTRTLLSCGVIAGPLYVIVGVIEMLTRPGYDPLRHDLSLMSNGRLGWIHISLFILTGLLTIVGAIGMRRVLRGNCQDSPTEFQNLQVHHTRSIVFKWKIVIGFISPETMGCYNNGHRARQRFLTRYEGLSPSIKYYLRQRE